MCKRNIRLQIIYKLANRNRWRPGGSLLIATTPRCRVGRSSFPWITPFTLDLYLITLSVKQVTIKYHFLSLWYDSTWDWTPVSRTTGDHSDQIYKHKWRHLLCNSYPRRKWTRRHEFKPWTWLFVFHIVLIPLRKVWIQLFYLQLWIK